MADMQAYAPRYVLPDRMMCCASALATDEQPNVYLGMMPRPARLRYRESRALRRLPQYLSTL